MIGSQTPRGGDPANRLARGRRAEALAAAALAAVGFEILAQNVYIGGGELDIVAREGDVLCFVEVRARRSDRFGTPAATIGRAKQERLRRAASAYLCSMPRPWPRTRFDVVEVRGSEGAEDLTLLRDVLRELA